MRVDDPSREAVVQQQVFLLVRDGRRDRLGDVEPCAELGDLVAKTAQAREGPPLADDVSGEKANRGLEKDSREARGGRGPLPERLDTLRRQRVVRSLPGPTGLLARGEIPEPLEPLRLRVPLALGEVGVDTALPRHSHEIVGRGAVPADEDQDDVREGCQLRSRQRSDSELLLLRFGV